MEILNDLLNAIDLGVVFAVYFIILVLAILVFFYSRSALRISIKSGLNPLPQSELPPVLTDAYNAIGRNLENHHLTYIGDFTFDYQTGSKNYLRLFKAEQENYLFYILAPQIKNGFVLLLRAVTWFENGNTLLSYNHAHRLFVTSPNYIYRQFPLCMPFDLARLHKEYTGQLSAKTKIKELPEDKALPGLIDNIFSEGKHSLLQKKYFKKSRVDEKYVQYTFRGILKEYCTILADSIWPGKNSHLVKDKPFTGGFKPIIGSTLYTKLPITKPGGLKKLLLWLLLFLLLFLLLEFMG